MAMCTNCGDQYSDRRLDLGYNTCMPCGDHVAQTIRFTVVNGHKSNYMVVSNLDDLKGLNKYAHY